MVAIIFYVILILIVCARVCVSYFFLERSSYLVATCTFPHSPISCHIFHSPCVTVSIFVQCDTRYMHEFCWFNLIMESTFSTDYVEKEIHVHWNAYFQFNRLPIHFSSTSMYCDRLLNFSSVNCHFQFTFILWNMWNFVVTLIAARLSPENDIFLNERIWK